MDTPPDEHITDTEARRKLRHGAILEITQGAFEQMLDLPPDVNVVAVHIDAMRGSLVLHLIGDSLPQVPGNGMMPKRADLTFQAKRDDEGHWWRRLRFHVWE